MHGGRGQRPRAWTAEDVAVRPWTWTAEDAASGQGLLAATWP